MIHSRRGCRLVVHTYDGPQLFLGGLAAGRIGILALLSGLFVALRYAKMAQDVRGAPVLEVYPFSTWALHRTGMMVMIQGLRGRSHSHGPFWSLAPLPSGLAAGRRGQALRPLSCSPPVLMAYPSSTGARLLII
jgi:hypothetical protein